MRQYDIERSQQAVIYKRCNFESLAVEGVPVHRRMPHKIEREMISQFPDYVRKNLK